MELELLEVDEAAKKPAGRGREEPNQHPTLDAPAYAQLYYTLTILLFSK